MKLVGAATYREWSPIVDLLVQATQLLQLGFQQEGYDLRLAHRCLFVVGEPRYFVSRYNALTTLLLGAN